MNKIYELFNLNKPAGKVNFGVEIELENITKHIGGLNHWNQEDDGSLRDNGREFIFNSPKNMLKSKLALEELEESFKALGVRPKASNLTSTHIHIDVRDMTVEQVLSFTAALMVVEIDLAKASGADRYNNYFALSTSESDHRKRDLIMVRSDEDFKAFIRKQVRTDVRYCGINFNSIHRYGSLEIRYLGGQAKPTEVMPWLRFYANLKQLVLDGIDYNQLFASVSERGTQEVFDMFKPPFQLTQDNVIEGIRNAQDFIFKTEYRVLTAPENGNGLMDYYHRL